MDQYYYRVDAVSSLAENPSRQISGHRWDDQRGPWPHKALLHAKQALRPAQAIVAVSFWEEETAARQDLAGRSTQRPYLLMRVLRETVREKLAGWRFEADDYLPPVTPAALIWSVVPEDDVVEGYCQDGISFKNIEAWDKSAGWVPLALSSAIGPEDVHMNRCAFHPFLYRGKHNQAHTLYYRHLHIATTAGGHQTWIIVIPSQRSPRRHLAYDQELAIIALEQLMDGRYSSVAEVVDGLLIFDADDRHIHTAAYGIAQRPWVPAIESLGAKLQRFWYGRQVPVQPTLQIVRRANPAETIHSLIETLNLPHVFHDEHIAY